MFWHLKWRWLNGERRIAGWHRFGVPLGVICIIEHLGSLSTLISGLCVSGGRKGEEERHVSYEEEEKLCCMYAEEVESKKEEEIKQ